MVQSTRLAASILAVASGLAFAAYAQTGKSGTKTFHATLSSAQEVPPVASNGNGTGEFTFDPATKQLTWTVSYSGLTSAAAAAHIHGPAGPGENAGVMVPLASGAPANPIKGTATLTDAQIAEITSGKTYVNIHTANNKGGEIRGQLMP